MQENRLTSWGWSFISLFTRFYVYQEVVQDSFRSINSMSNLFWLVDDLGDVLHLPLWGLFGLRKGEAFHRSHDFKDVFFFLLWITILQVPTRKLMKQNTTPGNKTTKTNIETLDAQKTLLYISGQISSRPSHEFLGPQKASWGSEPPLIFGKSRLMKY